MSEYVPSTEARLPGEAGTTVAWPAGSPREPHSEPRNPMVARPRPRNRAVRPGTI